MSWEWLLWVGANIVAFPALMWTGWLLILKFLVALDKRAIPSPSRTSRMLALRNVRVAIAGLVATGLFLIMDLALLMVGATYYGRPVEPWIAIGTAVVVAGLVALCYGVHWDLELTERAAQLAEEERNARWD